MHDDEAQIMEERALLDWAKRAPQAPGSWDGPQASEDEQAHYESERQRWLNEKPATRNPYENDRR